MYIYKLEQIIVTLTRFLHLQIGLIIISKNRVDKSDKAIVLELTDDWPLVRSDTDISLFQSFVRNMMASVNRETWHAKENQSLST